MNSGTADDGSGSAGHSDQDPPSDTPSAGAFLGANVASFESRQLVAMQQLIRKHGGQPWVSRSMQDCPVTDAGQRPLFDFAQTLLTGGIDTVIAMTGVGFRYLIDALSVRFQRQQILDFMSDVTTIARGPKPNAAMHQLGVSATYKVGHPHTWRDILKLVDEQGLAANRNIAVLEYGETNPSLIAGLEARGAVVLPVTIYKWKLPDDVQPLRDNIQRIIDRQIDVTLFTSAQQVVHLLQVAQELGCREVLIDRLSQTVIASIGPTTTERLLEFQLPVYLEPDQGKMARLVAAAANYWQQHRDQKHRPIAHKWVPNSYSQEGKKMSSSDIDTSSLGSNKTLDAGLLADRTLTENVAKEFASQPWYDGPFLKACRREATDVTPVWLMRQAGRYMQEYQEVRSKLTFLELCKNPSLCSEVMCTAVAKLGVDAAIIFSDLLPILEPMGFDLTFGPGHGPQIHNPIRVSLDVDRVTELVDMDSLDFVVETVRQTRNDLPRHLPVIGFAGSPFTLASYCIEGGGSKNYANTKRLMYSDEIAWNTLMRKLTFSVARYLNAQVRAGAGCVQLFDSWVGALSPTDYQRYVLPHMIQLIQALPGNVPVINFGTGNPQLLPYYAAAKPSVVGVDWRMELDAAWDWIGEEFAVQGNLDPLVLLADQTIIRRQVQRILGQANGRPGHIFNLGHGIIPETPVENAVALVEMVHEISSR